jgi:hypothetical protein
MSKSACLVALALLLAVPQTYAQSRGRGGQQSRRGGPGTGNPDEHLLPWKFVEKDVPLPKGPITLYWLPASLDDSERSRLMTSRALGEAVTRCVDLEIIVNGSAAVLDKLGVAGRVPVAVLADGQGRVVRRTENVHGVLRAEDVERMVADELSARDEAMYREMTEANRQASAGNKQAAIDLYKKIWEDRCLFPLAGSEAQRSLKALGVIVQEPPSAPPPDPNLQPKVKTETRHGSL